MLANERGRRYFRESCGRWVMNERVRRRLRDALNGDLENMDPATRRGLTVLADEMDGIHGVAREIKDNLTTLKQIMITSSTLIVVAAVANIFLGGSVP